VTQKRREKIVKILQRLSSGGMEKGARRGAKGGAGHQGGKKNFFPCKRKKKKKPFLTRKEFHSRAKEDQRKGPTCKAQGPPGGEKKRETFLSAEKKMRDLPGGEKNNTTLEKG